MRPWTSHITSEFLPVNWVLIIKTHNKLRCVTSAREEIDIIISGPEKKKKKKDKKPVS